MSSRSGPVAPPGDVVPPLATAGAGSGVGMVMVAVATAGAVGAGVGVGCVISTKELKFSNQNFVFSHYV